MRSWSTPGLCDTHTASGDRTCAAGALRASVTRTRPAGTEHAQLEHSGPLRHAHGQRGTEHAQLEHSGPLQHAHGQRGQNMRSWGAAKKAPRKGLNFISF